MKIYKNSILFLLISALYFPINAIYQLALKEQNIIKSLVKDGKIDSFTATIQAAFTSNAKNSEERQEQFDRDMAYTKFLLQITNSTGIQDALMNSFIEHYNEKYLNVPATEANKLTYLGGLLDLHNSFPSFTQLNSSIENTYKTLNGINPAEVKTVADLRDYLEKLNEINTGSIQPGVLNPENRRIYEEIINYSINAFIKTHENTSFIIKIINLITDIFKSDDQKSIRKELVDELKMKLAQRNSATQSQDIGTMLNEMIDRTGRQNTTIADIPASEKHGTVIIDQDNQQTPTTESSDHETMISRDATPY